MLVANTEGFLGENDILVTRSHFFLNSDFNCVRVL